MIPINQTIFNESHENKKSEKLGKSGQTGTVKATQSFKNTSLFGNYSTHFVYILSSHIGALKEVI